MPSRYLVTGGAGFVGSHLVLALADRGDHVVAIDTLRTGHRRAVAQGVRLIEGGIGDVALLDRVLPADGGFDAVFHLAAWSQVGESMSMPMQYLLANAADGFRLIDACVRHGVRRFVLSSTAALDVKQMGERSAGCVKKTSNRHAVREMKEGPSGPPCRGRPQAATSCFSQKLR
ncbi:MAG TPA: NAD-dependent epimerase/dehydratase family protein [Acetobacteraceae bacterium]|nr:NAD-dependent epimerase/dehydratase family protein [Acetobacteraceae bacterium]